jgi:alginate O-acetyltransferase complex protein AlgI
MALLADPVFADPGAFRPYVLWAAALAYAIQVYCDFSGYTDMALGCARLLGYRLTKNFDRPYLSPNIAELWRRWHISLSNWLRDYLFIPLGGSKAGRLRTYGNLMIVMVLAGLWHGAAWTFVVFGLAQGVWLCLHRAFRDRARNHPGLDAILKTPAGTALRVAVTFMCWTCLLTVFRSPTLGSAAVFLSRMFSVTAPGRSEPFSLTCIAVLAGLVVAGHIFSDPAFRRRLSYTTPAAVQGLAYACAMTVTLVLAPGAGKTFIYFQF